MENNLVMEKSWKIGRKKKIKIIDNILKNAMEQSWNFSYQESCTRSSDNAISMDLLQ